MLHFNVDVKTPNITYKVNGERFQSADEFFRVNRSRQAIRESWDDSDMNNYSFRKVHSYDEAKDLLFNGYTEALDEFVKVINMVGNDKKKVSFRNDIVGFQPNVPNYLMGIPKNISCSTSRK